MFVAGENSADQHASRLILALRAQIPDLECFGYGGPLMAKAGMHLEFNLAENLPIIGITQAIRHYPELKRLFKQASDMLRDARPDALVLVDYPGFNLRLAEVASELNVPVIYYIAPQVWAWHYSRIKTLARTVSLLLVIFPFEEPLFRKEGINAHYVGHPLLDLPPPARSPQEVRADLSLAEDDLLIGLLPGSRRSELKYHLEPMLRAAQLIAERLPQAVFVLPRAHTVDARELRHAVASCGAVRLHIVEEDHASVRHALGFAICKSGTSTLELALAGVPMIVLYRVSIPTYLFARAVVRTPWISLVNIVAGKQLVPEILQHAMTPENIAKSALEFLESPKKRAELRAELVRLKESFGEPGCAPRAASKIVEFLRTRQLL
jgi:lipid-A-disaccharide synthase